MESQGVLPPARAQVALTRLLAVRTRRAELKPLLSSAWPLRHNFTIGDAIYVVLARSMNPTLATADLGIARAPSLGVAVIA